MAKASYSRGGLAVMSDFSVTPHCRSLLQIFQSILVDYLFDPNIDSEENHKLDITAFSMSIPANNDRYSRPTLSHWHPLTQVMSDSCAQLIYTKHLIFWIKLFQNVYQVLIWSTDHKTANKQKNPHHSDHL